jgi:hypothetical protein
MRGEEREGKCCLKNEIKINRGRARRERVRGEWVYILMTTGRLMSPLRKNCRLI